MRTVNRAAVSVSSPIRWSVVVRRSGMPFCWIPRSDAMVDHRLHIHVDIGGSLSGCQKTAEIRNGSDEDQVSIKKTCYVEGWVGNYHQLHQKESVQPRLTPLFNTYVLQMPVLDGIHMDLLGNAMLSAIAGIQFSIIR